jgi:hypothetical protein
MIFPALGNPFMPNFNLGDVFSQSQNPIEFGPSDKNQPQYLNQGPGIYLISFQNGTKVYVGQSDSVVSRLGSHYDQLIKGRHECKTLQNDWNQYGEDQFQFINLSVGPQWKDLKLRIEAESKLTSLNANIVYNEVIGGRRPKKPSDLFKKPVSYKGQVFASRAEARRITGVPDSTIKRRCDDPTNLDWQNVDLPDATSDLNMVGMTSSRPIMAYGRFYRSKRFVASELVIGRKRLGSEKQLNDPKSDIRYATNEEIAAYYAGVKESEIISDEISSGENSSKEP